MLLKQLQLPNGVQIEAEVVRTPEQLREGLMGRDSLPPNGGMLFCFAGPGQHSMWMANTRIPLDILWISSSGRIVEIADRGVDLVLAGRGAPGLVALIRSRRHA